MRNVIITILTALLICPPASAAFTGTTQWDVRTTGLDTNGGCFDPYIASAGTDRSQADTPFISYTDLLVGATTTQYTSVLNPPTTALIGNCINVQSGVGCTVQRVQVVSVASSIATVDKSLGTAASVCTGDLGGGLLTNALAWSLFVSGNTVWTKSGTYTITSGITTPASVQFYWIGYGSAHGDDGPAPLITTSTNSVVLFTINTGVIVATMHNLAFSHTAASRGNCIQNDSSVPPLITISNASLTGCVYGVAAEGGVSGQNVNQLTVSNSTFASNLGSDVLWGGALKLYGNFINGGNSTAGNGMIESAVSGSSLDAVGNVLVNGTAKGIVQSLANVAYGKIYSNTFGNIGTVCMDFGVLAFAGQSLIAQNNIFYGCGTVGLAVLPSLRIYGVNVRNNAFGNNGTDYTGVPAGIGDVSIGADPFTNSGGGDYSLNNASTGGALLRSAGYPGLLGGSTTSYPPIGAVAPQQTSGQRVYSSQ